MEFNTEKLVEYYKNQIWKMLGLFESEDRNGYKHAEKILSELEHLPKRIPLLYKDKRFDVVLIKVDILVDELISMDGEQQFVKNHVMESLNLLDDIKEGLR